jgi:predicted  nucleic acid-binding Zn-ribbon protein
MEMKMAKPLSEQLSELSVHAKNAEDALAAAQKEARDKIVVRKEQARTAATAAVEKVNQEAKSIGDSATRNWGTVKAKIAADMTALKAKAADVKRKIDVKTAEDYADEMEWEAGFAIDYAIASVEQAKLAVLDALDSRVQAEQVKRA